MSNFDITLRAASIRFRQAAERPPRPSTRRALCRGALGWGMGQGLHHGWLGQGGVQPAYGRAPWIAAKTASKAPRLNNRREKKGGGGSGSERRLSGY